MRDPIANVVIFAQFGANGRVGMESQIKMLADAPADLQMTPGMALYRLRFYFIIDNIFSLFFDQIFELCPAQKIECFIKDCTKSFQIFRGSTSLANFLIEEADQPIVSLPCFARKAHD